MPDNTQINRILMVSIITINYNNKLGLEATIESVQNQSSELFEHIIIDGGSDDGSKEVMQQHLNSFNYWISEADQGVYHAMNKGIDQASGNFLLFLNSGDTFYSSSSLEQISPFLKLDFDIIYADVMLRLDEGNITIQTHPDPLSFSYFMKRTLCHQSTLIKKSLFETYGYYNTDYKIISDWEFFIKRIFLNHAACMKVNQILSIYDMNGMSANHENYPLIVEERRDVLNKNFKGFLNDYERAKSYEDQLDYIDKKIGDQFINLLRRPFYLKVQKIFTKCFSFFYKLKDSKS